MANNKDNMKIYTADVIKYDSFITRASWRLKSPATRLLFPQTVQVNINKNIKTVRYWPFVWESPCDRWIPHTIGQ